MAKHHRQTKTWQEPLSIEEFLTAAILASSLFGKEFESVTLSAEVTLKDVEVKASTIDELREDLQGVSDREVSRLELCVMAEGATAILTADPPGTADQTAQRTNLRTSGADATRVIGLHGQIERALTKRFDQLTAKPPAPVETRVGGITIGSISGSVGSISGGDVASSPTGSSSIVSGPLEGDLKPWWRNEWFVAIGGGGVVALIVYLLSHLALPACYILPG